MINNNNECTESVNPHDMIIYMKDGRFLPIVSFLENIF